jgi:molecular chaperone DnaK (HSP70)
MIDLISIDFGVQKCRIACMDGDSPVIIPNKFSDSGMPLIVEYSGKSYSRLWEKRPVRSSPWSFSSVKQKIGFDGPIVLNGKRYESMDLAASIFSSIKEDAEKYLGRNIHRAVITVPSCFTDKQRVAIKTSAEKSGFDVIRLLDESIAVVLALYTKEEEDYKNIIYALGGGVFTVSAIKVNNGIPQSLWHEGKIQLGGNEFDASIISYILDRFPLQSDSVARKINHAFIKRLKIHTEQVKIKLSKESSGEIVIDLGNEFKTSVAGIDVKQLRLPFTRTEFEDMISGYIDNTISITNKMIDKSDLNRKDIDKFILVGGSTRIPLIKKMIKEEFGDRIIKASDELIAIGAAIYGAQIPAVTKDENRERKNWHNAPKSNEETILPKKTHSLQLEDETWKKEFLPYLTDAQADWRNGSEDEAIDTLENMLKELHKFIANLYHIKGKEIFDSNEIDQALLYLEKGLVHNKDDEQLGKAYHKACGKKGFKLAKKGNLFEARSVVKKGLTYYSDCAGCKEVLKNIEDAIKIKRRSGKKTLGRYRRKKKC